MIGRAGLNEAEFVRTREFLEANPNDGPALFAAKGSDAANNPVAARRYADLCLNSFADHTLVVLADGSRVPISAVDVGQLVAAYDVDREQVMSGVVTASLSHSDVLFDAALSDGSMLSVTEDHRVWDSSVSGWRPIGEFGADGGVLLGLGGETITVTGFDDASGELATAWDVSVAGVHNFFVAADQSATPVLVHNADEVCALSVSLEVFDELVRFVDDPATSSAAVAGLNSFFDEALDVGQRAGLSQTEFEAALTQVARLADESPETLAEIAARGPCWLSAGLTAGPTRFGQLLEAADDVPLLRQVSDDAIASLVTRSDFAFSEILGEIGSLNRFASDASRPLVNSFLAQEDLLGGLRQLQGGADSVRYEDGLPLNVIGERVDVRRPARERLLSGTIDNGDYFVDGILVRVRGSFPIFERFMGEGINRRQILFYDFTLESSNSLGRRLPPDFRKANEEMQSRVLRWDLGELADPAIEEMPEALRQFFRDGRGFSQSPRPLDGSEQAWHHHQETGRMQLLETQLHAALTHSGEIACGARSS